MSRKTEILFVHIVLIIQRCIAIHNGYNEVYSTLLSGHDYMVPPNKGNITVSSNLELLNILQIDTRNQEMTFSAILNLYWKDSALTWNQKEFPLVNRVTLPSVKIWTPDIIIWNSAADSNNIQRIGGDLFISPNGQVHWPVFGNFKTSCTIDVTYYPFDQQTCVVKLGPVDNTIQIDVYNRNTVDLGQYYMSVYWSIVEAPAYRNVYIPLNEEFPVETDVTYYLVIKRKTHWLSEVCPLLAFAFVTIIPAAVTRSLEKLILQVFCMAGLFALHKDTMTKLPPTSFVTPLVSKYIVALILFNFIHLTLATIINNSPREYFDWTAQRFYKKNVTERKKNEQVYAKQDIIEIEQKEFMTTIQYEEDHSNLTDRQKYTAGNKIVVICNRIILILLILAVTISTLCFLFGHPNSNFEGIV